MAIPLWYHNGAGLRITATDFLSSDRVSFSTGAVYDISGGRATY